jgi:hypothetical protein
MTSIIVVPPAAIPMLEAQSASADTPAPYVERDWLREGRDYLTGERWTNAPPEMVIALMRHIEELEAACDVRDQLISWLVDGETSGQAACRS